MALSVGITAPNFITKDESGNTVALSSFKGKTVVLYFYPKDDAPACAKEAQGFRDHYETYQAHDVVVFGVSRDDETSHRAFKEKYNLPFTLLSDATGLITQAYDVDGGGYSQRVTYIINDAGIVDQVFETVKAATHAQDILAMVAKEERLAA